MSSADRRFTPVDRRVLYEGRVVSLAIARFRYPDGDVVEREIVHHQGAVAVVAHDDEYVYLVRQPRETVGDPDFLEIPAGRLDVAGESPLAAAQRELAEEIGKGAERWEPITVFASSVGMSDELVHVFHATGLHDRQAAVEENERIEIVAWPLADLDHAIGAVRDAKSLIGLLWLKVDRA